MDYTIGRKERIQVPLEIVRFSNGGKKIGKERYAACTKGFDPFLANEMIDAGISAGRKFYRKEGRQPGTIRVYNLQTRLEVEIN